MAKQFEQLTDKLTTFIQQQKIFFVGTADVDGRVNVSPKGMDSIRVISPKQIAWLNLTGSGNETAGHLLALNRITLMFCSFTQKPLILRVYGKASIYHPDDELFEKLDAQFPNYSGKRQIFLVDIEMVQTSCGFAVPNYEYLGEKDMLTKWSDKKGEQGIEDYWQEKNTETIDGKPTDIARK